MSARYAPLAAFLALVVLSSWLATSFEAGSWYQDTAKPGWTPPDWFYAPALAVIYVLMAAAAWQVWLGRHSMRTGAVLWWLLLLVLNIAWSWLIFGLHRPGWAFMLSAITLGVAILCWRAFFMLSPKAGLMLTPYVLWAGFVCFLNYAIWTLNQGGIGRLFS